MNDKKIRAEKKRLEALLVRAEIPKQQQDVLKPVIDNLSWQRVKLDETRKEMAGASVVCEYNNGGGQSGVRENPIFKGYVSLWRAYMLGLEKYTSYLPKEFHEEAEGESLTMLERVQSMKKEDRENERKSDSEN